MHVDVLIADPLLHVTLDPETKIVRYDRTELGWPSLDDLRRVHDALLKVVVGLPRREYAILLDLRRAPPRNDEAYEKAIEGYVGLLIGHFSRYAMLVKTAAGRLQVVRLEKRVGRRASPVFYAEDEALAHVRARD
jgi:hypothetical protein